MYIEYYIYIYISVYLYTYLYVYSTNMYSLICGSHQPAMAQPQSAIPVQTAFWVLFKTMRFVGSTVSRSEVGHQNGYWLGLYLRTRTVTMPVQRQERRQGQSRGQHSDMYVCSMYVFMCVYIYIYGTPPPSDLPFVVVLSTFSKGSGPKMTKFHKIKVFQNTTAYVTSQFQKFRN